MHVDGWYPELSLLQNCLPISLGLTFLLLHLNWAYLSGRLHFIGVIFVNTLYVWDAVITSLTNKNQSKDLA